MIIEIDRIKYFRDLQGRYWLSAGNENEFFADTQVGCHERLWDRLEGHPLVIAEKIRVAKWAERTMYKHEHKRNPIEAREAKRRIFA